MSVTRPSNLQRPFCDTGTKNTVPVLDQTATKENGISYETGFPDITMLAKSAGGQPPLGQDMNGILHAITEHTKFQNCGGRYRFDAVLAAAIGGYPEGFVLQNDAGTAEYRSEIDNNSGNFNSNPELIGVTWTLYTGMLNPRVISGTLVRGFMWGGNITRTAAHQLTILPCSCLDSTMTKQLYYNTNFTITIPTVANAIYHIFLVRLVADGSFSWRAYTTEAGVTADAEVSHYRWRTFWNVDSDGNLVNGTLREDILAYGGKLAISSAPGAGFSYAAADAGLLVATYSLFGSGPSGATRTDYPDISSLVPLGRVAELVPYNRGWMTSGVNGYALCGIKDSINTVGGIAGFGYGGLMIGTQLLSYMSAYYETTMNSSVYIKSMRILC